MTLVEEIEKWNARWKRDWWWRQKYNIPFGSKQHREANQIDISFEYFESSLYNKAIEGLKKEEEKEKRFRETGMWISERTLKEEDENALWDKIDLSKL